MGNFIIDTNHCLEILRSGGVILFPTDTIWGLGCDATNAKAVDKILKIKGRPVSKGLIVLMADEKEIPHYVSQTPIHIFDYINGVSKPTTVIYQGSKNIATNIPAPDGSLAIRLVKDDFCKQLIRKLGRPLVSTSANLNGFPSPAIYKEIDEVIKSSADYVVHHRREETDVREASSVIKWMPDGSLEIIRP